MAVREFSPPTNAVDQVFKIPAKPGSDTFEIALVLGGTVSAAAYTAGVVDFLIEALDAWSAAKLRGDACAPRHNVVIKVVAGTSGGALTAVLLARVLRYVFPPCNAALTNRSLNPFYDTWVNQIDIKDLLDPSDLNTKKTASGLVDTVGSILNAEKIGDVGEKLARYASDQKASRTYVEQQLPLIITTTNLQGIPYSSDFHGTSNRAEYFVDHADHIRLRIDLPGSRPAAGEEYETVISDDVSTGASPWLTAIAAGRASGAFPVGLPAISYSRPIEQYRYRYTIFNSGVQAGKPVWLNPKWDAMTSNDPTDPLYQILCVDGGCFNNEPIRLADDWLNGVAQTRDTDPVTSHRAVLLVDPFADAPSTDLIKTDLLSVGGAALSAFVGGARFDTAELDLFTDEDAYSRFLINPVSNRGGKPFTGGAAIATDPLGAFGGFLQQVYRDHDFQLGRRNCQQMLRQNFILSADNELFAGWTNAIAPAARAQAPVGFLPIIPLMPELQPEIPAPSWPLDQFNEASFRTLLKNRLTPLAKIAAASLNVATSPPLSWFRNLILSGIDDKAIEFIVGKVRKGLYDGKLLSRQ